MDINYFKEFVTIVEAGTYLEAAERLFISQSTLSRHIQNFEVELGCILFERTTRKVRLSKFGEIMLPYAKRIIETQKEYTQAILQNLEDAQISITVGSIPALGQYNITEVLAEFKKLNPRFTIQVIEAESNVLIDLLRQRECDFAFVREADGYDTGNEFAKVPYATDNLVAILPASHPLSKSESLSLLELHNESFILLPQDTLMYRLCVEACKKAGFDPRVIFTSYRGENIISMVETGAGVSLLMKKPVVHLTQYKVVFIDIIPRIYTHISLYYRKGTKLSPAEELFLKCAKSLRSLDYS